MHPAMKMLFTSREKTAPFGAFGVASLSPRRVLRYGLYEIHQYIFLSKDTRLRRSISHSTTDLHDILQVAYGAIPR